MPADSFDVVPDELRAHASHLDGLVDRLHTAGSAARTVSMSDEAYGLLCAFLPPVINPMEEQAMTAIDGAAEGLTTSAENVRTAAAGYDAQEETSADPFTRQLAEQEGRS